MDITKLVDGKRKLAEQQTDISTFENLVGCVMMTCKKNSTNANDKTNRVEFVSLAVGTTVQDLKLVEAPLTTPIGEIITANPGFLLIFAGKLWVDSKETPVVALRKM